MTAYFTACYQVARFLSSDEIYTVRGNVSYFCMMKSHLYAVIARTSYAFFICAALELFGRQRMDAIPRYKYPLNLELKI